MRRFKDIVADYWLLVVEIAIAVATVLALSLGGES